MTTAYSTLMGLAEPVQGELSGTWGDTVNKGITEYLDVALAGTQTISGTQTAVTLSLTNGNASATNIAQAGSGATGSAQFAIINCTGAPVSLLTITVPASSRQYIVINATSTSQSVKVVGAGPTTGVTIVSGEKAHIAWNGSDFVKIASSTATGDVTAAGNNAFTGANTFFNATGQTFAPATANDGIIVKGRAGGTSSYRVTLTPTTLSASRTVTYPDADTTIPVATQVLTFSGPTAARTITLPDSNTSVPIATQTLTFSGPTAARTYTLPDSASTLAALATAQTFTATQTFYQGNYSNNAVTVSSNAGTVPITYKLNTFTNSSAAAMTITMATASAVDGQMSIVRIYDFSAVAQTISWVNTENSTVTAPVTSNGSTTLPLTVGFMYNGQTSKWRCIASA